MESQPRTQLGEELWRLCTEGTAEAVRSYISQQRAANPSYTPPLSAIMQVATSRDRADIVAYCLKQGTKVTDPIMSSLVSSGAYQTHKVLVESNAVAIDRYVPWFGTVLAVAAAGGKYEWTKFCLEHGADPNKDKVEEYKTVLAAAAEGGHVDVVTLLLEHGAKMEGSGTIVIAAEAGKTETIEFLLQNGANIHEIGVEHPTDERETEDMGSALHKAVDGGHKETVKFLLDNGADVNLKDVQGRTALKLARQSNRSAIAALLESRGATE